MIAPAWETFASTAGGGNDDMECAVRCSQSATCTSKIYTIHYFVRFCSEHLLFCCNVFFAAFIMSGGSCHISAIAPVAADFVASNSTTTSFYTKA